MIMAQFDSKCPECGGDIVRGEWIGKIDGAWACESCAEDETESEESAPVPGSESLLFDAAAPDPIDWIDPDAASSVVSGTPDQHPTQDASDFLDPDGAVPELNASGQPRPEYEFWGNQNRGYLVTDPDTGEYRLYPQFKKPRKKGWTRVTTFVKAASESIALEKWGKRNVLLGAARSPKLVDQAYGKTHEDARELDSIVAKLEDVAGAKNSADHGTAVHELTERWDAGQLRVEDAPPRYREALELYIACLAENGLVPVPGLIERTTCVTEFGGVAGTFDNVYFHPASSRYVLGDKKTGKTMEYARNEYEAQLAVYAHGVNRHGVFDWNTKRWQPPGSYGDSVETGPWSIPHVSEDVGVIIHLPLQGEWAGTCRALRADLREGWAHAELCAQAIARRERLKDMPLWDGTEFAGGRNWDVEFSSVYSNEEASRLWLEAKAAGVERLELQRLVRLAQDALIPF